MDVRHRLHLELLAPRPVLIGHFVMDVVLVAFAALSWTEMRRGVHLAWKVVLLGVEQTACIANEVYQY